MAIFGTMLAMAFSIFSTGLKTKRSTDLNLGVQQNLRAAMQVISQDLRAAGVTHLFNQSTCSSSVACSNNTQIAILALTGVNSAIATTPGTSTATTTTAVCNPSVFSTQPGQNVVIRYNGSPINANANNNAINFGFNNARVLELTGIAVQPSPTASCSASNQGTLTHAQQSFSDSIQLDGQSFVFQAALNTYFLGPDPIDSSKYALYQRSGMSAANSTTAVVAYGIQQNGLKIAYGVRTNATSAGSSTMHYYDTLTLAATAANTASTLQTTAVGTASYSAIPDTANTTYVGGIVTAVRITTPPSSH
jgi:hypothetical protein